MQSAAQRILALGDSVPAKDAAAIVGCSPERVRSVRWWANNKKRYTAHQSASRARRIDSVHRQQREYSLKTKVDGGRIEGSADKAKLKRLLALGKSFSQIATVFGVSRSCVAGHVHRLRKAGEIA